MKLNPTTFALFCCISSVFGELEDNNEPFCLINDERFAEGENVGERFDLCNNCACSKYGFGCSEMGCPWIESKDCEIHGQHYKNYGTVPSNDCGACYCMYGNLACTNCQECSFVLQRTYV